MRHHNIIYSTLKLTSTLAIFAASTAIILTPAQAQTGANRAKQSEGKQITDAILRTQQAYYLENSKFATSLQELDDANTSLNGETSLNRSFPNYQFSITKLGGNFVQINAVPKLSSLKSYVGFVYIEEKTKEAVSIRGLCESNHSNSTVPKLSITNKKLKCPAGYTDLVLS
jgi:type II secretory pathway pseudopilin PulG